MSDTSISKEMRPPAVEAVQSTAQCTTYIFLCRVDFVRRWTKKRALHPLTREQVIKCDVSPPVAFELNLFASRAPAVIG